jgi:hypothetical protein
MEREKTQDMNQRFGSRHLVLAAVLVGLFAGVVLLWTFRDDLRSPQALYHEA